VAYELFERRVTRIDQPALSVLPDGRITLNAASTRLFEGAGAKAVTILWDKAACGIALQVAKKGDQNAYSIAFSRGRSASISAKTFLPFIGWSADQRQTVPATWNSEQKMLEAELPSQFVGTAVDETKTEGRPDKFARVSRSRSPGASMNIRNWMALNETPKKSP
jgi:hypothetical protein